MIWDLFKFERIFLSLSLPRLSASSRHANPVTVAGPLIIIDPHTYHGAAPSALVQVHRQPVSPWLW